MPYAFTHPGFASTYCPGANRARLLVPTEDFGHTAVGNSQLSRDYAGPDAVVGHLYYLVADMIWQRPSIDENSTELVHPALSQWR